jgi:hypothetical protein
MKHDVTAIAFVEDPDGHTSYINPLGEMLKDLF